MKMIIFDCEQMWTNISELKFTRIFVNVYLFVINGVNW